MDRRSFLKTALILPSVLPEQRPMTQLRATERDGFLRCRISHVRGFNLAECEVRLPFGIWITKVMIEFEDLKELRNRMAYLLDKPPHWVDDIIESRLVDLANHELEFDWFFLRSIEDRWKMNVHGHWLAELWVCPAYSMAIRFADWVENEIQKKFEVEEKKTP